MASITYTVTEVKNKINQFADKLGSDYFTLPVLLNRFETSTWDFVGEKLKEIEATQTVTDDISPLIVRANLIVLPQLILDLLPISHLLQHTLAQSLQIIIGLLLTMLFTTTALLPAEWTKYHKLNTKQQK